MRSKPFKRAMRRKYINRRKRIARKLYGKYFEIIDGEYDKGKVHCSCPMCSRKTNNKGKNRLKHGNYYPSKDWKHSDKQKIESMDAAIVDYECEITEIEALGTYFPRQFNAFEYYDDANWAYENELLEKMIADLPD